MVKSVDEILEYDENMSISKRLKQLEELGIEYEEIKKEWSEGYYYKEESLKHRELRSGGLIYEEHCIKILEDDDPVVPALFDLITHDPMIQICFRYEMNVKNPDYEQT